jgi:hypothetical protein
MQCNENENMGLKLAGLNLARDRYQAPSAQDLYEMHSKRHECCP